MEILANDKLLLEQKLTNEKANLANENQNLAEQLASVTSQLKETESLYIKEQQVKNQLESYLESVNNEKSMMQASLQLNVEENTSMKTEILRLQALLEKHKLNSDTLENKLMESEAKVQEYVGICEENAIKTKLLEQDKEDLISQISVLVEEKEATQAHAQELFEQLENKTTDLELLQESYVIMSDRCNDAYDEISDLKEQLESVMMHAKAQRRSDDNVGLIGSASLNQLATKVSGPALIIKPKSSENSTKYDISNTAITSRSVGDIDDPYGYDDDFETQEEYADEFEDNEE